MKKLFVTVLTLVFLVSASSYVLAADTPAPKHGKNKHAHVEHKGAKPGKSTVKGN